MVGPLMCMGTDAGEKIACARARIMLDVRVTNLEVVSRVSWSAVTRDGGRSGSCATNAFGEKRMSEAYSIPSRNEREKYQKDGKSKKSYIID